MESRYENNNITLKNMMPFLAMEGINVEGIQMKCPEFVAANSFLAFNIYRNHLDLCMVDGACLLCVFVDTFVCFWL